MTTFCLHQDEAKSRRNWLTYNFSDDDYQLAVGYEACPHCDRDVKLLVVFNNDNAAALAVLNWNEQPL